MLTVPHDFEEKIADYLIAVGRAESDWQIAFRRLHAIFCDWRVYNLEDAHIPEEDVWGLEMALYADGVKRLPDMIMDIGAEHPNPQVRRGWIEFCRREGTEDLRYCLRDTMRDDPDPETREAAANVYAFLSAKADFHKHYDAAGRPGLSRGEIREILGDMRYPDNAKRDAIDCLWPYTELKELSAKERQEREKELQPGLKEFVPLLLENYLHPLVGLDLFNVHLGGVLGQLSPPDYRVIKADEYLLSLWWWPPAKTVWRPD